MFISPLSVLAQSSHQKSCVIINMKTGPSVTGTFVHAGEDSILIADEGGKLLTVKREGIVNFKLDPLAGRTTCPSSGFPSPSTQPAASENKAATATAKGDSTPLINRSTLALSNTDILEMQKAGLGAAIILAKIKGSATNFDTSTAALKTLKEAGVADEVILAVVESSNSPRQASSSAPSTEDQMSGHHGSDSTAAMEAAPADPFLAMRIPPNSKVYIAPFKSEDAEKPVEGFETYMAAALRKKNVPLIMVADRSQADFEIVGSADKKGAGFAKKWLLGDFRGTTSASLTVTNLHTGVVAYADASHRASANKGLRSSAEKLAKYLKRKIQDDEKRFARMSR
jgi:hypothetical protein